MVDPDDICGAEEPLQFGLSPLAVPKQQCNSWRRYGNLAAAHGPLTHRADARRTPDHGGGGELAGTIPRPRVGR
jgi:hypothetical protein